MVRLRVRIRFCKQDDLRLIGHRDLMRCFERLFRRASVPLGMSQGFHPKPRMTFPLPLAVGIEGADEVMELEMAESLSAEDLLARLKSQAPRGLTPLSVEILAPGAKKARAQSASYQAPIQPPLDCGLGERIERLLAQSTLKITPHPWPIAHRSAPHAGRIVFPPRRAVHALEDQAGRLRRSPRRARGIGTGGSRIARRAFDAHSRGIGP